MSAIESELRLIAAAVFDERMAEWERSTLAVEADSDLAEIRRRLALINAKERISVGEAAVLLSCSDGHLRNLIRKAKKGQTERPIPFLDLDGPTVFDRIALLEWARAPKGKSAKKGSTKLRAVK